MADHTFHYSVTGLLCVNGNADLKITLAAVVAERTRSHRAYEAANVALGNQLLEGGLRFGGSGCTSECGVPCGSRFTIKKDAEIGMTTTGYLAAIIHATYPGAVSELRERLEPTEFLEGMPDLV